MRRRVRNGCAGSETKMGLSKQLRFPIKVAKQFFGVVVVHGCLR